MTEPEGKPEPWMLAAARDIFEGTHGCRRTQSCKFCGEPCACQKCAHVAATRVETALDAPTSQAYASHVRDAYQDGCECAMCGMVRAIVAAQAAEIERLISAVNQRTAESQRWSRRWEEEKARAEAAEALVEEMRTGLQDAMGYVEGIHLGGEGKAKAQWRALLDRSRKGNGA